MSQKSNGIEPGEEKSEANSEDDGSEQSIDDDDENDNNSCKEAADNDTADENGPKIVVEDEFSEYQSDIDDKNYKGSELPSTPHNSDSKTDESRRANAPKNLKTLINDPYQVMNLDQLSADKQDQQPAVNNIIMLDLQKFNEIEVIKLHASKDTPQYGFGRKIREFGDLGWEATKQELD